jgi:hypothetical protein
MVEPTLLAYLAREKIDCLVRKGRFVQEHVRFGPYLHSAEGLYETGVAIGSVCREKLPILAELFSEPGQGAKSVAALEKSAASQMEQASIAPETFLDLFFKPEVERFMAELRAAGQTRCVRWTAFPKVFRKKLLPEQAYSAAETALRKGIAFGSFYPQLADCLASRAPDPETWTIFRARASDLPESPLPGPLLSSRHVEATALLREYVEQFRADLLLPLGLWPQDTHDTRLRLRALYARQRNG